MRGRGERELCDVRTWHVLKIWCGQTQPKRLATLTKWLYLVVGREMHYKWFPVYSLHTVHYKIIRLYGLLAVYGYVHCPKWRPLVHLFRGYWTLTVLPYCPLLPLLQHPGTTPKFTSLITSWSYQERRRIPPGTAGTPEESEDRWWAHLCPWCPYSWTWLETLSPDRRSPSCTCFAYSAHKIASRDNRIFTWHSIAFIGEEG